MLQQAESPSGQIEAPRPRLLADPDFRRIWAAGALAQTVRWLELLAVSVFVFRLTGSPFLVAFVLFLRMLPSFLFGAFTGALAERLDRKRLLACGLAVLASAHAVLGTLVLAELIAVWHVALGVFLNGIFWSMDHPVRRMLLGEIAGFESVGRAMSLDSSTVNATRALGPTLGGVLLATVGMHGAYFLGTALFATGALLVFGVRRAQAPPPAGQADILANIRDGLRYIRSSRILTGTLAVTVLMNFWGFAYIGMVPVIGSQVLGLGALGNGLLLATEGLGAFCAALVLAWKVEPRHYTRIYAWGSALFLAAVLAFSLSRSPAVSFPALLVAGCGFAGFAAMQSTIVLSATPPGLRPRVMGVLAVCIGGGGPLGILHVGLLADWLGAAAAVTLSICQGLAAMLVLARLRPELFREFVPPTPPPAPAATGTAPRR